MLIRDDDLTTGPSVASAQFVFETSPLRLQFRFNQDVGPSLSAADLEITGPAGTPASALTYSSDTNTATLSFGGLLPNGNFSARVIAAGITNASGQGMPGDYTYPFFFMNGDANRDRMVDINDLATLATHWQQSPRVFSQADFNLDAKVDIADLAILATNWQASLAAPPVLAASGRRAMAVRVAEGVLG